MIMFYPNPFCNKVSYKKTALSMLIRIKFKIQKIGPIYELFELFTVRTYTLDA